MVLVGIVYRIRVISRPWSARAVAVAFMGAALAALVGCQSGLPPTPTLPPPLDFTVTSTWRSLMPSVTAIPSLTASMTSMLTATLEVTAPTMPQATGRASLPAIPAETPATWWITIPPPIELATLRAPAPVVISPRGGPPSQLGGGRPETPINPGFEGDLVEQGAKEIVVPEGWAAWWRTGPVECDIYAALDTTGPCPATENPALEYKRPEFSVIPAEGRWLDPPRVVGTGQAARFFCTYGICEGGYFQQVQVQPGQAYTLSAQVHAWCSQNTQDPYHSQQQSRDERLNCALAVGLDPTGGLDPRSPDIIWQSITAYDSFAPVHTPPVQAQGAMMTLYLKGRSLWPVRHNDFHFDAVAFGPG